MQSQSEITNTKSWNEEEIRDLILFAQSLRQENEELRAKIIAMDAYVKNGDAKLKQLQMVLKKYMI
jgi:erythromycin esterase-like protein